MGQRQLRFRGQQINPDSLGQYNGSFVEAILLGGQTYSGYLELMKDGSLAILDINAKWYNQASHRHKLVLDQVMEISVLVSRTY
jgi:hypothetical protein